MFSFRIRQFHLEPRISQQMMSYKQITFFHKKKFFTRNRMGMNEHPLAPTTMGISQNSLKFHFLCKSSLKTAFQ